MGRPQSEQAIAFRKATGYTGKMTKKEMGDKLWNEYYKLYFKAKNKSEEHIKEVEERRSIKKEETIRYNQLLKNEGIKYKIYCTDFKNIENYDKAKADGFKGWHCHHRLETHTSDGERRLLDITSKELVALDMYYDRPPEELIFMRTRDHMQLHMKCKTAWNKGMIFSEETKAKMSAARKGKHWELVDGKRVYY